ncbi:hypothetical protein D9M70_549220 [compost metagenome]
MFPARWRRGVGGDRGEPELPAGVDFQLVAVGEQGADLLDQLAAVRRIQPALQLLGAGEAQHAGEQVLGRALVAHHVDAEVAGVALGDADGMAQPAFVVLFPPLLDPVADQQGHDIA